MKSNDHKPRNEHTNKQTKLEAFHSIRYWSRAGKKIVCHHLSFHTQSA